MTRKELAVRINQIDPEDPGAVEALAELFEEDYLSMGKDLQDPEQLDELFKRTETDLRRFMEKYDRLLGKINNELRKAGATEAQINWGLFGDVELPTFAFLRCNFMARRLIRYSYQIVYCLGELKMLSKYMDLDAEEYERIRREYNRKFG